MAKKKHKNDITEIQKTENLGFVDASESPEKSEPDAPPAAEDQPTDLDEPRKKKKFLKRLLIGLGIFVVVVIVSSVCIFYHFYGQTNYTKDSDVSRLTISELRAAADAATESDEKEELQRLADESDVLSADEQELIRQQQMAVKLPENKDVYNILLIGADARKKKNYNNSDAMLLVSIDSANKVIHLTSFMRDMYAIVPGYGGRKLNSAYGLGRGPLLVETIENNWKIPIDNYASVDFAAVVHVVDTLGGVDIDVTEEELPVMNTYVRQLSKYFGKSVEEHQIEKAGRIHCDGIQALGYMRIRAVGFDYARTHRQRIVLQAIMKKLKTMNVSQMLSVAEQILPYITHNVDEGRVLALLTSAPAILTYDIAESRVPYDGLFKSYNQNLVCDFPATIERLHKEIYENQGGTVTQDSSGSTGSKRKYPRGYHGVLEEESDGYL